jgi:isoleucyl-tRNA synthetase
LTNDEEGHGVVYKLKIDWPVLGKKLRQHTARVKAALNSVSSAQAKAFLETRTITVAGITLEDEDLQVSPPFPHDIKLCLR